MAEESQYSPALNEAILANIQKDIERKKAKDLAAVQGQASARNISGGTFEGRGTGAAITAAQDASTQAALQTAIANADYVNRQNEIKQAQGFQSGEAEKNRLFGSSERVATQTFNAGQADIQRQFEDLERQKQEAFASGQTDKAQQFQEKQNALQRQFETDSATTAYERSKMEQGRQNRADLLKTGIESVASIGGSLFCFLPASLVEMADGSMKSIGLIEVGENTRGGKVISVRESVLDGDLYSYKGIYVMGMHEVKEHGEWKYVKDCIEAILIPKVETTHMKRVYTLITKNHRIWIFDNHGLSHEFMDECVKDTGYSLAELNKQEVISNGK